MHQSPLTFRLAAKYLFLFPVWTLNKTVAKWIWSSYSTIFILSKRACDFIWVLYDCIFKNSIEYGEHDFFCIQADQSVDSYLIVQLVYPNFSIPIILFKVTFGLVCATKRNCEKAEVIVPFPFLIELLQTHFEDVGVSLFSLLLLSPGSQHPQPIPQRTGIISRRSGLLSEEVYNDKRHRINWRCSTTIRATS